MYLWHLNRRVSSVQSQRVIARWLVIQKTTIYSTVHSTLTHNSWSMKSELGESDLCIHFLQQQKNSSLDQFTRIINQNSAHYPRLRPRNIVLSGDKRSTRDHNYCINIIFLMIWAPYVVDSWCRFLYSPSLDFIPRERIFPVQVSIVCWPAGLMRCRPVHDATDSSSSNMWSLLSWGLISNRYTTRCPANDDGHGQNKTDFWHVYHSTAEAYSFSPRSCLLWAEMHLTQSSPCLTGDWTTFAVTLWTYRKLFISQSRLQALH